MYLLGRDRVYLVQVVAGCAWVPEKRIWAPEVFITGEGIHFTVGDSVRLMAQLNHANIIVADTEDHTPQQTHRGTEMWGDERVAGH